MCDKIFCCLFRDVLYTLVDNIPSVLVSEFIAHRVNFSV